MQHPAVMRTGLDDGQMTTAQQDTMEQVMAVVASMMQQAVCDAAAYVAQAQRTVILPRDIELALKRLVLPGSAYWRNDALVEDTAAIRRDLFSGEDDDFQMVDAEDAEVLPEDVCWTEARGSTLACEMNAAPARFAEWKPDNPFMAAVKRATEHASATMQASEGTATPSTAPPPCTPAPTSS
jgi:histone H3/H4